MRLMDEQESIVFFHKGDGVGDLFHVFCILRCM